MTKFYVLEPHVDGTTAYSPDGDNNTREGDENELQHLVELGVLSTDKPKAAKSEPAPKNKSEPAPANKSA